jgi:hypothetical protein
VFGFCSWREGLVLRPELADRISGVKDVAEGGLRLVNREPGAEARSLLDRLLADAGIEGSQLSGYDTRADGHLQVAAAIAAGLPMPGSRASRPPLPMIWPSSRLPPNDSTSPSRRASQHPRGTGAPESTLLSVAAQPAGELARI